ncbi:MAG: M48 family metallopeptidase [Lewinella sp.]
MRRKTAEQRATLDLNGMQVPVRIITERGRRSTIASVRQRALYIRLPHALGQRERKKRIQEMVEWARKTAADRPEAFAHLVAPPVAEAYTFDFRGEKYRVSVENHPGKMHHIEPVTERSLTVKLSSCAPAQQQTKAIPKLLAKYFAGGCLPEITRRVHELNDRHFRKAIHEVKLSDTYTRWGSCSHRGNINLATRLLLAPPAVLDAVIIHELAHLLEANHGPKFWAHVARALPEYKVHDRWLRENGPALRFDPVPID